MRLIEHTLCLYQWLMQPSHQKHYLLDTIDHTDQIVESTAMTRIRNYLTMYVDLIKKREGRGCKTNKFHHPLHYVRNMLKDGSVQNFDTGRPESNAVSMYKNLSTTTQLRQKTLNTQIGLRHYEDLVLQDAHQIMSNLLNPHRSNLKGSNNDIHWCGGSKYQLQFHIEEDGPNPISRGICISKWITNGAQGTFDAIIMTAIAKRLFLSGNILGGCLKYDSKPIGFTEFRPANSDTIFRAHPKFRGDKEWFDWCNLRWDGITQPIPARIITFLDLSKCEFMSEDDIIQLNIGENNFTIEVQGDDDTYLSKGMFVVVQSAHTFEDGRRLTDNDEYYEKYSFDGDIVKRFVLEDTYRILPVETIEAPCYCIPQYTNTNIPDYEEKRKRFLYFADIKDWGDVFIKS